MSDFAKCTKLPTDQQAACYAAEAMGSGGSSATSTATVEKRMFEGKAMAFDEFKAAACAKIDECDKMTPEKLEAAMQGMFRDPEITSPVPSADPIPEAPADQNPPPDTTSEYVYDVGFHGFTEVAVGVDFASSFGNASPSDGTATSVGSVANDMGGTSAGPVDLGNGTSAISSGLKSVGSDSSYTTPGASNSHTDLTVQAGAGGEYLFANGAFVGGSALFRFARGKSPSGINGFSSGNLYGAKAGLHAGSFVGKGFKLYAGVMYNFSYVDDMLAGL